MLSVAPSAVGACRTWTRCIGKPTSCRFRAGATSRSCNTVDTFYEMSFAVDRTYFESFVSDRLSNITGLYGCQAAAARVRDSRETRYWAAAIALRKRMSDTPKNAAPIAVMASSCGHTIERSAPR